MLDVTLIGYGAIGQAICQRLTSHARLRIRYVVVREARLAQVQAQLDGGACAPGSQAVSSVPSEARLVLECAGHEALEAHVLPALARGRELALIHM